MADFALTPAQQQVVNCSGHTMLVSAAAGSGKTRVLVERLMKKVCDPVHACNIDEFLIITYTKAAAEELRTRISAALAERLAEEPDNRHLQRQMNRLYLTQISTVHAFCSSILREYMHKVELPPDFSIAEEQTVAVLKNRALEDTLDEEYQQIDTNAAMASLLDITGNKRDDTRLENVILQLYDAVQSHPRPEQWIEACRTSLNLKGITDAGETKWGEYLMDELRKTAQFWLPRIEQDIASMENDEKLLLNYVPSFKEMKRQLLFLQEDRGWDAVHDLVYDNLAKNGEVFCVAQFTSKGKKDTGELAAWRKEKQEEMKAERDKCKAAMIQVLSPFQADSNKALSDLRQSTDALQELLTLVQEFSERFRSEKYRQRLLDYNDLEHEAIKLLTTKKDGQPTPVAREISDRYAEIMVDEFQDSNAVQETIFEAVSKNGQNRFMVGDVKQSIYKFRLADPTIFLDKYRRYKLCKQAEPGEPCKCLMSNNFRSDPQILNAVNFVFRAVMSERVGDLPYGDDEALYPPEGKETALEEPAVELHVIYQDMNDTEESRAPDKKDVEAMFVASRIQELVKTGAPVFDGSEKRPVHYGDIVILMRTPGSSSGAYVRALEKAGIPVSCTRGSSLFDTAEVTALVSLLQVIDNPRRDIPLTAVLLSPLAGFTYDELAEIRLLKKNADYREALQLAAEKSEKPRNFVSLLNNLRTFAPAETVTRLLDQIWQQTEITAIYGAMEDGAQRVRNLESIYDLSLEFDGTLQKFLELLEGKKKDKLATAAPLAADNCVRIMSVHQAKGLEFPVVFLSDLCHGFNLQDTSGAVLVHPKYGLGGYALSSADTENRIKFPTIAHAAISSVLKKESLSEELRVLYVAMTRPQSRLIMTMCRDDIDREKDKNRKFMKLARSAALPMPAEVAAAADSAGDWILLAALCRQEGEQLDMLECPAAEIDDTPWKIRRYRASELLKSAPDVRQTEPAAAGTSEPAKISADISAEQILSAMQFVYPHAQDTRVPSKLTATQVKGRRLDEETAEGAGNPQVPEIYITRPQFRHGPLPLTAAERGTATHLVMQFVDFSRCHTLEGVKQELNRLAAQEYITQQQAEAVHPEQIAAFFASPIGQKLSAAEEVLREFKFSLLVPAGLYYPGSTGEILLQGVVDCCMVEESGLTILDFKTDRVTDETIDARAEYYRGQIDAYTAALEKIFDREVKARILYFFNAGKAVSV